MRLLIDDDSTCSKDRACAQQPDKTFVSLPLFRFWDRRDEFGAASAVGDLLRGLPVVIKLPVP